MKNKLKATLKNNFIYLAIGVSFATSLVAIVLGSQQYPALESSLYNVEDVNWTTCTTNEEIIPSERMLHALRCYNSTREES